MGPTNFLAFDVETATAERSSICQLGYVLVKNLEIVKEDSFLIKPPENDYSSMNSQIHGLCSLDTSDAPIFPNIWEKIENEFSSNLLIAHNASFDIRALSSTLEYYNIDVPKLDYFCTFEHTRLKLKSLCESLEIAFENHHNALSDAKACAESFIKLIKGKRPNTALIKEVKSVDPFAFKGHERLKGDVLKPNFDIEDKDNPFYKKKVVFTGVLNSISRKNAALLVKDKGADIDTGVTKKTDYVIVGTAAGPSKLKKIEKYNEAGANIEIIREEMFLNMVDLEKQ